MPFMQPEFSNEGFSLLSVGSGEEVWIPTCHLSETDGTVLKVSENGTWFSRLSAPGYLDATEWNGPYSSEAAARTGLANVYGVCETCMEECWDSDSPCDEEYTDGMDDNGTEESTFVLEPQEQAPTTCRLCGESGCQGPLNGH